MAPKRFHLHLVSDSTGETVSSVARACVVQFENVEALHHLWWLVRSPRQVDLVIEGIRNNPGIVLATLIDSDVRALLEDACRRERTPFIPVLDPVMATFSSYLDSKFGAEPGRQHALDAEYFRRIEAMHFALAHDDGQLAENIDQADIVLVGVSRTSKTPTCMYLANRGVKAANIPLIFGMPPPPELLAATHPMIVGLTREAKSLSEFRRSRLRSINQDDTAAYADVDRVREEVTESRRLFTRQGWPVIDVTRRSIEEVAAAILQLYAARNERLGAPP